jgi:hypothetical protein
MKKEEKILQINLQETKNFLPLQSQTKREAGSATQTVNEIKTQVFERGKRDKAAPRRESEKVLKKDNQ